MNAIVALVQHHPVGSAVLAWWIFSNAVGTLPTPQSSQLYKFVFAFLHSIAGNLPRIAATMLPPSIAKIFNPGA